MTEDRRRPGEYESARDDRLRRWATESVHPFSRPLRAALDEAGLHKRGMRRTADLQRVPIVSVAELGDGRRHVLEPDAAGVEERAGWSLSTRLWLAEALGRRDRFAAGHVDPEFKPVAWTVADVAGSPLFVANAAPDLDRLAELGRRALGISGVTAGDRILLLAPTGSGIAHLQLVGGARMSGVPVLHADAADAVVQQLANATVVAGTLAVVGKVAADGLGPAVRLLLVLDGPIAADRRDELRDRGVDVADWWTPPGARAAWARCRAGRGFHTWPTWEVTEIVDRSGEPADRGRLVWSAVGWHGSVWWRVDTGRLAGIDPEACACGRTTPRLVPLVRRA